MKIEEVIQKRAEEKCELCKGTDTLKMYEVLSPNGTTEENCILICAKCTAQIEKKEELDSKHWQCLAESMWSEVPGIQIVAWRMLNRLRNESWAMDNLDMLYLDDEKLAWAKATGDHESDGSVDLHKDSNGHVLQNGDSVVLIKSLDVKGSTINAKLGTVVRNIRLVDNNTEQIEGRIEGQVIVILTKYVRKQH
ncbi:MAG: PhnA domain-containing protein [Chitinophagaceae bacterium]|nr:PhnA domain-containing protein [Chitinophagaceae bacterium]MBK8311615.1 PhnA domain-containing protein [Chitinophagaceae bacterium]MBK8605725.1 PhnA domain-containing protein [Chitinophagaceae bacterium]MBP7107534.1 PhnA domain-containing protein [Chitinophagaceae bacterium]MBP7315682.1 PhnA domain-containing protein [Chitinophagaceae bacterium]